METIQTSHVPIHLWAPPAEVEASALQQLRNIATLPWVFHHIAAMPDVHFGIGATVGSVVAMKEAVAPAAVGVDIGCGMAAVRTNLTADRLPESLKAIRSQIERDIPVGFNAHREAIVHPEAKALWQDFASLDDRVHNLKAKAMVQLGTLGGGNHFIELCLDSANQVWLLLHSGSRNIGKSLAEIHIAKAKKLVHNQALPDPNLAVFLQGTPEMKAYRHDLFWAQRYAAANRLIMLDLYLQALQRFFPDVKAMQTVSCHHNYVAEERHFGEKVLVTRKGAIRAGQGEYGIIPGSMGTRSYIVRGLGNANAFESASHGAGRRMSRGEAKRRFTKADLERQTAGVECRKDIGVIDEIPAAYKDIDQVMANQNDLVEVVTQLRQVLCVKG